MRRPVDCTGLYLVRVRVCVCVCVCACACVCVCVCAACARVLTQSYLTLFQTHDQ